MSDTTITLAVNVLTAERATSTHKNVKIINPVIVLTTIDSIMQIVISISIVCVGCIIIYLMPLLRVRTIIIININVMLNMQMTYTIMFRLINKWFVFVRWNTISIVIASVMENSTYQCYAHKYNDYGHDMSVTMAIRLWLRVEL